jgi:hypothetical protein
MKPIIVHSSVNSTAMEYESIDDPNANVNVTDWINGDGIDISMDTTGSQVECSMTWEQWKMLKKAVKAHLKHNVDLQDGLGEQ